VPVDASAARVVPEVSLVPRIVKACGRARVGASSGCRVPVWAPPQMRSGQRLRGRLTLVATQSRFSAQLAADGSPRPADPEQEDLVLRQNRRLTDVIPAPLSTSVSATPCGARPPLPPHRTRWHRAESGTQRRAGLPPAWARTRGRPCRRAGNPSRHARHSVDSDRGAALVGASLVMPRSSPVATPAENRHRKGCRPRSHRHGTHPSAQHVLTGSDLGRAVSAPR